MNSATSIATKLSLVVYLILIGACTSLDKSEGANAGNTVDSRDNALLNDGYSLLYEAVSGLRFSDEFLMVKYESDQLEDLANKVSSVAAELRDKLDMLKQDYPALDYSRSPLPAIEVKRREAFVADRFKMMAPIAGRAGPAFERTLLLTSSGAVDQTRYLSQVMAAREPDPNLKKFLLNTEQQFAVLYDQIMRVLKNDYYR